MDRIAPYAKALIGALVAGLASLQQALDDGAVSAQEWTGVIIALLSGLALVWAIPNNDPEGRRQDESVQPPDRGAIDTGTAIVIAVLVVLVLVVAGAFR